MALLDLGDQSERPVVAAGGRSLWSSGGGVLRKTELPSGRLIRTLTPADLDLGVVDDAFAVSPDGSTLAVAAGSQLALVDTPSGAVRHVVPVIGGMDRISFSADGSKMALRGRHSHGLGHQRRANRSSCSCRMTAGGGRRSTGSGATLYTAPFDGMLLAWDLSGERGFLPSLGGQSTVERSGCRSSPRTGGACCGGAGARSRGSSIQDVATGAESRASRPASRDFAAGSTARWSPDGALVTVQTGDDVLAVWDSTTLEEVARRALPDGEAGGLRRVHRAGASARGDDPGPNPRPRRPYPRPRREPVAVAPALGDGACRRRRRCAHARPERRDVLAGVEGGGLFLVDTVSGAVRPLDLGVDAFGVAWSPDGRTPRGDHEGRCGRAPRGRRTGGWPRSRTGSRSPGGPRRSRPTAREWAVGASGRVGRWDGRTGAFLGARQRRGAAAVQYVPDGPPCS